jgi:hypothetical protein
MRSDGLESFRARFAANLPSSPPLCFPYRSLEISPVRLDFVAQRSQRLGQFLQTQIKASFYGA